MLFVAVPVNEFGWLNVPLRWAAGDMKLPSRVQEAMQMQVEAERKKRAAILESEGRTKV